MKIGSKCRLGAIVLCVTSIMTINGSIAGLSPIVFDPTNYRQNLVTAIRNVQQVNNQIRQLDNEIRMLANQANDLKSLPYSIRSEIKSRLAEIDKLVEEAESISMSVQEMERLYKKSFPDEYSSMTNSETIIKAQEQWNLTRGAYKDAIMIQSQVKNLVADDQVTLDQLIQVSQGARGNLQAIQAGNQLVALQTKQLLQNQLLIASHYRAEALEKTAAEEARTRSKARFNKFLNGSSSAYTRK